MSKYLLILKAIVSVTDSETGYSPPNIEYTKEVQFECKPDALEENIKLQKSAYKAFMQGKMAQAYTPGADPGLTISVVQVLPL